MPPQGRKHSPETIAKIKDARAKQIITDEHKKNISKELKRIGHKPPSWKGKHHSEESKRKISESRKGSKHYNWKGGIIKKGRYMITHCPNHPFCDARGYVKQHRLVMEKHLGRYLKPEEVVHHINEDTFNNSLNNLILFPNHSAHMKFHHKHKR